MQKVSATKKLLLSGTGFWYLKKYMILENFSCISYTLFSINVNIILFYLSSVDGWLVVVVLVSVSLLNMWIWLRI